MNENLIIGIISAIPGLIAVAVQLLGFRSENEKVSSEAEKNDAEAAKIIQDSALKLMESHKNRIEELENRVAVLEAREAKWQKEKIELMNKLDQEIERRRQESEELLDQIAGLRLEKMEYLRGACRLAAQVRALGGEPVYVPPSLEEVQ